MPRYIDAEIAQKFFRAMASSKEIKPFTKIDWEDAYRVAAYSIDEIPTADVAPVVHAHWEKVKGGVHYPYRCSRCGDKADSNEYMHCHCGARMDEEVKKDGTQ